MAEEKVYPEGIRVFPKHEKAPDFVLGQTVISIEDFNNFVNKNRQYLSDYKGKSQLKLNILKGDKGIYFTVDTYKKAEGITNEHAKKVSQQDEDAPF